MRSISRHFRSANQYPAPSQYGPGQQGVQNPYSVHLHNWRGGPLNEGNLAHGPNYNEPMFGLPSMARPLWGVGSFEPGLGPAADTRNGVFSGQGYGGGIFAGMNGLGEDDARPFYITPDKVPVWGIPQPAFIPAQVKLNVVLASAGKAPIRTDGVLDSSYCQALVGLDQAHWTDYSLSLTPEEADASYLAYSQCGIPGTEKPETLPCWMPGTRNPSCKGQPTPPQPLPPKPSQGCQPGLVLDPNTGLCKIPGGGLPIPIPIPASNCPAGQVRNPLTGQCELSGGWLNIPNPPRPLPSTQCPAGQVFNLLTGKCELAPSPLPPNPKPPTACPAGQELNPTTGKCELKSTPAPDKSSSAVPYAVGALVLLGIGLGIAFWPRKPSSK